MENINIVVGVYFKSILKVRPSCQTKSIWPSVDIILYDVFAYVHDRKKTLLAILNSCSDYTVYIVLVNKKSKKCHWPLELEKKSTDKGVN